MEKKNAQQWSFIFDQFGQDNLRKMLFKMAVNKEESDRVVIEFRGNEALDVTEHVEELEQRLEA